MGVPAGQETQVSREIGLTILLSLPQYSLRPRLIPVILWGPSVLLRGGR